ncbi:cytosol aminopeptidase family protein [Medicago truncatula]|uniref:Cytosol aminopeptidase family protein n=1 Tax=Medicago truncatula TaxID=3880 RepID=A0A072V8W3_MEDTR|nr:cytosol aminopeptidase family protein [Medicago truncatula]
MSGAASSSTILTTSLVFSSSFSSSRLFIRRRLPLRSASSPLRRLCLTREVPVRNLIMPPRATLGFTHPANTETPKISFAAKDIDTDVAEWKGDLLAVAVTEKDVTRDGELKFQNSILRTLDSKLGGLLGEASSEEDFTGKLGQSTLLRITPAAGLGSKRLALLGLGPSASSTAAFKTLGESVASAANFAQAAHVAVVVLPTSKGLSAPNIASAIATGTVVGTFEDNRFKSESKKKPVLKSLDIIGLGTGPEFEKKLKYAGDVSSGIILGKELVNSPPNVLTPGVLAEEASKIASTYSDVFTAKVLDAEQCKELKMGSYLAVAAASANPPQFIHLCYKPPTGPVNVKLALVGKGLTFDR